MGSDGTAQTCSPIPLHPGVALLTHDLWSSQAQVQSLVPAGGAVATGETASVTGGGVGVSHSDLTRGRAPASRGNKCI